jgi:hypothetical protein
MAQAASRRLPTAAPLVRAQLRLCGICGGQSDSRGGFLILLRFPPPIHIPPATPHSSSVIQGWYNRPKHWPMYQVDSVSPHPKKLENLR